LVLGLVPSVSEACSPPRTCEGDVIALAGLVPANLPALWWTPLGREVAPYTMGQSVVVRRVDGAAVATTVEAPSMWPATRLVRFAAPLEPDAAYELAADSPCTAGGSAVSVRFQTGPAAPLPTTVGTLSFGLPQSALVSVDDGLATGICGPMFPAITHRVSVALSPEAEPWRNALQYDMTVDGVRWAWRSFRSVNLRPATGLPDLYIPCGAPFQGTLQFIRVLSPGRHTVTVRAFLPGSTVSQTLTGDIELQCPAPADSGVPADASTPSDTPAPVDAPAPSDLGPLPDVIVSVDAGLPVDAGVVSDLGAPVDASGAADAGPADTGVAPPEGGGGCRMSPAPTTPRTMALWLVAALAALGARRRKAHATTSPRGARGG